MKIPSSTTLALLGGSIATNAASVLTSLAGGPAALAGAACFGALSSFLAQRFSRKINEILDDKDRQFASIAASGELPPNHDLEKAAREAFRRTLLFLCEQFAQMPEVGAWDDFGSRAEKMWKKELADILRQAESLPDSLPWPDFSLLADSPAEACSALWNGGVNVFASTLSDAAMEWFGKFKTPLPDAVRKAVKDGWPNPDNPALRRTLAFVWGEFFRASLKNGGPATLASVFSTLAGLGDLLSEVKAGQTEITKEFKAQFENFFAKQKDQANALFDQIRAGITIEANFEEFYRTFEAKLDEIAAITIEVRDLLKEMRKEGKTLAKIREETGENQTKLLDEIRAFIKSVQQESKPSVEDRELV